MKTLYFDIDGTILPLEEEGPKPALASGAFEHAVRAAGFQRLVCVGQIVATVRTLKLINPDTDDLADYYFAHADLKDIYAAHLGGRIHLADPLDDGKELLTWLAGSVVE